MYRGANRTLRKRLMKYIEVRSLFECWPWRGKVERNGYGRIRIGGRGSICAPSHRVAYWLLVEDGEEYAPGDPRWELQVDHTCEFKLCHNPAHLRLATGEENRWWRFHVRGEDEYREPHRMDERDIQDMDDMLMREDYG